MQFFTCKFREISGLYNDIPRTYLPESNTSHFIAVCFLAVQITVPAKILRFFSTFTLKMNFYSPEQSQGFKTFGCDS